MRNRLADHPYGRLSPRERLISIIHAMQRDDQVEVQRLYDTAPKREYRMVDAAFEDAQDAMRELVHLACIQLNLCIGKLHMATTMAAVTPVVTRFAAAETAEKLIHLLDATPEEKPDTAAPADPPADSSSPADGSLTEISLIDHTLRLFEQEHAKLVAGAAREAAAVLVSFDRFTRQVLGLDGMSVLRAWMPPVAKDVEKLHILSHKPNPEYVELWSKVWARWWNMLVAGEKCA